MNATAEVERGRECYRTHAWAEAHRALSEADAVAPLGPDDLELLARAAYMLAREDEYLSVLERAHHAHLDAGSGARAADCAFWMGLQLLLEGSTSRAMGWLGRARRLLDREGRDCVERGYLLIPELLERRAAGDLRGAHALAAEAAEIGARFGDPDLVAMVVQEQGHALVLQGHLEEGLRLIDETMVAVTAGELSPVVTGLIYCNTIAFCRDVDELRRAREWTDAMTRWCEEQPDMVAHTGICLVHRAEIMELAGAWSDALGEAAHAARRLAPRRPDSGYAHYRRGEVHRLRGELGAAQEAYRRASLCGYEPQPGLALLRLAEGNRRAAATAMRRLGDEVTDPLQRARLLPAYVEVMLALDDLAAARAACAELDELAERHGTEALGARSAQARGALALAQEDHRSALTALRRACQVWRDLVAPYEVARVRLLIGMACLGLGDEEAAVLEWDAARAEFRELGAAPDAARADHLLQGSSPAGAHGLTPRELQVLAMVAAGARNKEIAAELVLSERTIDRHVSNILAKLRLPSRAAATAYAYEHRLI